MELPVYHGDCLRRLRESLHYSESEVERRSGGHVRQPDISKWERNASTPDIEQLAWLGIVYDKSLMEMLDVVYTTEHVDGKAVA